MNFKRRRPIGPWARAAHEAYIFDTPHELLVARIMDEQSEGVVIWVRNDPAVLVIPTPAGNFKPDFLYVREDSAGRRHGLLEVKGGFLMQAPEQQDPIKARAASEWVRRANSAGAEPSWEFALVMDEDVPDCVSLDDLRTCAHTVTD